MSELVDIARVAIEQGLRDQNNPPDPSHLPERLRELRSSFVTLYQDGQLSGCCGSLRARLPLASDVWRAARAAAFEDPRFPPLRPETAGAVSLDIAVLSPLAPLAVEDEAALRELLGRTRPGVLLEYGTRHATFLPKVWDHLAEPGQFLRELKRKAGLAQDFWSHAINWYRYDCTTEQGPLRADGKFHDDP